MKQNKLTWWQTEGSSRDELRALDYSIIPFKGGYKAYHMGVELAQFFTSAPIEDAKFLCEEHFEANSKPIETKKLEFTLHPDGRWVTHIWDFKFELVDYSGMSDNGSPGWAAIATIHDKSTRIKMPHEPNTKEQAIQACQDYLSAVVKMLVA